MEKYYTRLNTIILNEIMHEQQIAIFPLGQVGLLAKNILNNRFGKKEIAIDNFLCNINPDVMSLEQFMAFDSERVSIIVCASEEKLNGVLRNELSKRGVKARVINILDNPVEMHPEKYDFFKEVVGSFQVKRVKDYNLVRLGSQRDGGYVMLDDFRNSSIAYSFGIADNVAWELDVADNEIDVFCYDPTVTGIIGNDSRLHFTRMGIAGDDNVNPLYCTLETLIKKNEHASQKNMILKIDVEGAEWDSLCSISPELLSRFAQISLELHDITDVSNRDKILKSVHNLTLHHQAIWIHANNAGRVEQAGNIKCPSLLEVTLVNKELYDLEECEYSCPINLDIPNTSIGNDIILEDWNKC